VKHGAWVRMIKLCLVRGGEFTTSSWTSNWEWCLKNRNNGGGGGWRLYKTCDPELEIKRVISNGWEIWRLLGKNDG
jgi:hypothetical protein